MEETVLSREQWGAANISSYSKQVNVLSGGALGALDFLPTLVLTVAEPCTSNLTAITQMEDFPTVELS